MEREEEESSLLTYPFDVRPVSSCEACKVCRPFGASFVSACVGFFPLVWGGFGKLKIVVVVVVVVSPVGGCGV